MLQITLFCGVRFSAWKSGGVKFWTLTCLTLTAPYIAQNSAKMFLSQRLHLLGVQQSTQALHSNHYQLLTDDFHIPYCQTARLPKPTLYTGYWERFRRPNGFPAQNLAALFSAVWHHCYCAMNSQEQLNERWHYKCFHRLWLMMSNAKLFERVRSPYGAQIWTWPKASVILECLRCSNLNVANYVSFGAIEKVYNGSGEEV